MEAEYTINNSALKQFYSPNFIEVDASKYDEEMFSK